MPPRVSFAFSGSRPAPGTIIGCTRTSPKDIDVWPAWPGQCVAEQQLFVGPGRPEAHLDPLIVLE
jgi:hypothetical protein